MVAVKVCSWRGVKTLVNTSARENVFFSCTKRLLQNLPLFADFQWFVHLMPLCTEVKPTLKVQENFNSKGKAHIACCLLVNPAFYLFPKLWTIGRK